ncbi:MAG: RidA family protein [Streptosporangiales bacterium]|nr:RidA family protein [Streptosporangiales bacterium]
MPEPSSSAAARQPVDVSSYHVPVPGFAQAVLAPAAGRLLFVSGLTARAADGEVLAVGDPAGQARVILDALRAILTEAGAGPEAVVRTVTYLVDMRHHAAVHEQRLRFFGDPPPASTTVEVTRLYDPSHLLEIEATAVIP